MRILIVEDSERLRRSLGRGLERLGHAVDMAADGPEGLAFAEAYDYEAIVLDLMLPGLPGLEVLSRLRRRGRGVPILILSARGEVADRVRGLELGADDYLSKPFAFDELAARLAALGRRRHGAKSPVLAVGPLAIDTARRQVLRDGEPLPLTPSEYGLLECLAYRRGSVLSQRQLLEHLRRGDTEVASNVIEVLVSSLRRKIQRPGEPPWILTRRGFGYLVE